MPPANLVTISCIIALRRLRIPCIPSCPDPQIQGAPPSAKCFVDQELVDMHALLPCVNILELLGF